VLLQRKFILVESEKNMFMKRLPEIRWIVSGVAFNFRMTGMMVARISASLASFTISDVSTWTSVASKNRTQIMTDILMKFTLYLL